MSNRRIHPAEMPTQEETKIMRRLLTSTLLGTAAASAALILSASAASAATFDVSGANADGTAIGDSGAATLTTPRTTLRCQSSEATAGDLFNGSSNGTPLAHIT